MEVAPLLPCLMADSSAMGSGSWSRPAVRTGSSAVSASGRAGRLGLTGGRGGAPSGKKFCLFWGGCFRLESYLQFWKLINIRLLSA